MRNTNRAESPPRQWFQKRRTVSTENIVREDSDVTMTSDPSRVVCSGRGLKFGYLNLPILSEIDTRSAGPGELTVYCEGRDDQRNAYCDLSDHGDATFTMSVKAQDPGVHRLYVQYDGVDVPGSPFPLKVSKASLVRIDGPGLKDGVLDGFRGDFEIDSEEAGSGEIKLRVRGPKGAFKIQTEKVSRRVLHCHYNPAEDGFYLLHVLWSGEPLPESPFRVFVAQSQDELARYKQQQASTA